MFGAWDTPFKVVFQALLLPHCAFHCISIPARRALASCCHGHHARASIWKPDCGHHASVMLLSLVINLAIKFGLIVVCFLTLWFFTQQPQSRQLITFNSECEVQHGVSWPFCVCFYTFVSNWNIMGLYYFMLIQFCHVSSCWKLCPSQITKFFDLVIPESPPHTIIWFVLLF